MVPWRKIKELLIENEEWQMVAKVSVQTPGQKEDS